MSLPDQNQDQWNPTKTEKYVLDRMAMSVATARTLLTYCGFEFRYIDPDIHPRMVDGVKREHDGFIFGSRYCHERIFEFVAAQLAVPTSPQVRAKPEPKPVTKDPVQPRPLDNKSKGQLAYEGYEAGDSWSVIEKAFGMSNAVASAKAYAVKHDLAWPIIALTQLTE